MKTFKIKGFTLIELMVVIAIIGLLSSVILASLGNTRLRARDSAVRQIVGQMRNILATQYAENPNNPSYFAAAPNWLISAGVNNCADSSKFPVGFTAANSANLISLCNQIATLTSGQTGNVFFVGGTDNAGGTGSLNTGNVNSLGHVAPCDNTGPCYTILVKLPSTGLYYCASGKVGSPGNTSVGDSGTFMSPGCWDNP